MAMRIRSMSAGRSGASVYNANVNGDQGGGDSKQGLAPTTNKRVQFVLRAIQRRAYSDKDSRRMVFCQNQLGGVGRPSKMFATTQVVQISQTRPSQPRAVQYSRP